MPGLSNNVANVLARYGFPLLAGIVVSAIALPQFSSAFDGSSSEQPILLAQKDDPKKKKEQPRPQPKSPPKQEPKRAVQPPPKVTPRPEPKTVQPPPKAMPKPEPKTVQPPKLPKQEPKKTVQPPPKAQPGQDPRKTVTPPAKTLPKRDPKTVEPPPKLTPKRDPKTVEPAPKLAPKQDPRKTVEPPPKVLPKQDPKTGQPQFKKGGPGEQPPGIQKFGQPKPKTGPRFDSVDDIRNRRKETRDKSGRVVIVEPGGRRIIREGNRRVIIRDDGERMRRWGNARFEMRGAERYTIVRRGPYEIVTITDANGRLLRRFRRGPDGREHVLIDNRRRGLGVGAAVVGGIVALGLLAPRITIPRDRYIVDASEAPPTLLYETLDAPPVAPLERAYTFDEIRDNVELRDHVRSVDVSTINFASGSWELSPEQIPQLEALAEAMLKVISENPDTVFLIEGHTDAVGTPEDNLSLSDRRAETVAEILTTHFQVPPENLMTQGYGEQHLRVQTDGPSRENRRVQVRNITTLLAGKSG